MTLHLKTKIISIVIFSIFLYGIYLYMVELKLKQSFNQISKGDSPHQLRKLAGEPSYEISGENYNETKFPSLNNKFRSNCNTELWYEVKYSPLPSVWSYCFDSKDKLIHKYHWVSW